MAGEDSRGDLSEVEDLADDSEDLETEKREEGEEGDRQRVRPAKPEARSLEALLQGRRTPDASFRRLLIPARPIRPARPPA